QILETWQAGLVLTGNEAKAVKAGQISLKEAFIVPKKTELYLINAHIPLYEKSSQKKGYEPLRDRKLLLKKKEIARLIGLKTKEGLTIVPLKVYTKHHWIKLEIGLGRGKKQYDKREAIKKRDVTREIARGLF
ncbi:MAG: SsrA-binding protein SmpB, partial [Candidatus Magasanikbacteria bacterium]|nr:SsrA-binding protein SmpB [Candidatus Magasanikbacteria bacterium]